MGSIKVRYGKCRECAPDAPDKPLSTGLCPYHKKLERAEVYAQRKSDREVEAPPKPKKPIAPRSKKLAKEERLYRERERPEYLAEHEYCEARIKGCTHIATDIHHKEGRGKNLRNKATFLAPPS